MTRFLRLRHRLVPYLHTMNRRAHLDGEPLVQPMYYDHPDDLDAYRVRNQYRFGDRLLVAPITTPADRATGLGAVRAWLRGEHPPDTATVERVLAVARGDAVACEVGGGRRVARRLGRLRLVDANPPDADNKPSA